MDEQIKENVIETSEQEVAKAVKKPKKKLLVGLIIGLVVSVLGVLIYFLLTSSSVSEWPDLDIVLDSDTTVTSTIDSNGGVLEMDVSDLNVKLDIPKDSLLLETEILMTSIKSFGNESLNEGFIIGVDLSPDGTSLVGGATLTLALPANIDTTNIRVIAYEGNGEDVRYYPFSIVDGAVVIEISGFSGYGIGTGDEGYSGGSDASSAEQKASDLASDGDMSSEDFNAMKEVLSDWYKNSLKKNLEAATKDSSLIKDVIAEYVRWLGLIDFLGFEDEFNSEVSEAEKLIGQAITNAVEQASEKCVSDHDLDQIDEMIFWARFGNAFGLELEVDEKIRNCATFELSFDSTITGVGINDSIVHTTGTTPMILNEDLTSFSGSGLHTQQSYTDDGVECPGNPLPQRALTILDASISGSELSITIQLETYEEAEITHEHICEFENNFIFTYSGPDLWLLDYDPFHEDEAVNAKLINSATESTDLRGIGLDYKMTGWEILKGELYAKKVYSNSDDYSKESTIFELHHKPIR